MNRIIQFVLVVLVALPGLLNAQVVSADQKDITLLFNRNESRLFLGVNDAPFTVQIMTQGIENDEQKTAFVSRLSSQSGVVSVELNRWNNTEFYIGTITLAPGLSFDSYRDIFSAAGVSQLGFEERVQPIADVVPFTEEQIGKLAKLNEHISNIEIKLNYTLEHPEQLEQAKVNGWLEEALNLLAAAKQAKIDYLQSISVK